jgi:hypothetical protein
LEKDSQPAPLIQHPPAPILSPQASKSITKLGSQIHGDLMAENRSGMDRVQLDAVDHLSMKDVKSQIH